MPAILFAEIMYPVPVCKVKKKHDRVIKNNDEIKIVEGEVE